MGVSFGNILAHFKYIQVRGAPRSYFPEPTKRTLVVAPRNVARSEEFFWCIVMTVVTKTCYLGGFIGDQKAETMWLDEKVQEWA